MNCIVLFAMMIVRVLIGIVVCAPISLLALWQPVATAMLLGDAQGFVVAALGVIGIVAAMIVHELGHVAGVRLVQLPFRVMFLWFLRVENRNGKIAVGFRRRLHSPAAAVFFSATIADRWRTFVAILGGPLASLWLALLCLRIAMWINPEMPVPAGRLIKESDVWIRTLVHPNSMTAACLNFVGLCSLLLAVLTIVPDRTRTGFRTDGGQLLDLARGRWSPSPFPAELGDVVPAITRSDVEIRRSATCRLPDRPIG